MEKLKPELSIPFDSARDETAASERVPDSVEDFYKKIRVLLEDGRGECIFKFGPTAKTDDGPARGSKAKAGGDANSVESSLEKAEENLKAAVERHDAEISLLRRRATGGADFLIRKRTDHQDFIEVQVAVVGNSGAGKSTTLGVLTHCEVDNGRGHARSHLLRHKHEIESGRTSSVGNDILGFDSRGLVVNNPDPDANHLDWVQICQDGAKVVTFIDLPGHEKYLKTTIFGMTSHLPDYCMLTIGADAGVVGMTKEHLELALALNVPVFVVFTKIDTCPQNILADNVKVLQELLKSAGCRKLPILVHSIDDVVVSALNFVSEGICPIFQISNVTGQNLDLLELFLNLLMVRCRPSEKEPAEFQIDDTFAAPGVGTVVSGTCLKGVIHLNDSLLLGPDTAGNFQPIPIRSIHRKRMIVRKVVAGQTASFALKKIKRNAIRKGMVMMSEELQPAACWEFEADVLVLHHPTTISIEYQAVVHCGSVRQTATIIRMSQDCLRTGDKARVRFRFIKTPEYIRENERLVLREGTTKAVGNVVAVERYIPPTVAHEKAGGAKQATPRGLHPDTRQAVIDLFETGVKAPRHILFSLNEQGLPEPHGQQLKNFLQYYKKTKDLKQKPVRAGSFMDEAPEEGNETDSSDSNKVVGAVVPNSTYTVQRQFSRQSAAARQRQLEEKRNLKAAQIASADPRVPEAEIHPASASGGWSPVPMAHSPPSLPPAVSPARESGTYFVINGHPYRILNQIGAGGSSQVYQVYDEEREECLAVKSVDLSDVNQAVNTAYRNEIDLLKRLQKYPDRIVRMYDYEYRERERRLYVVMEKGDTDLDSLFKSRAQLSEQMIAFYWLEMLKAVQVIHKEGIVHSDLKPLNFLLVAGNLKLIDFGIANAVPADRTSVTRDCHLGTLSYMSPEAVAGAESGYLDEKLKVGVKSDVWSLGCILYMMVYGKTPFHDIRRPAVKMAAMLDPKYEIPFPAAADANVISVLKRCLERDPKRRAGIDELLEHPYCGCGDAGEGASASAGDDNLRVLTETISKSKPRTELD